MREVKPSPALQELKAKQRRYPGVKCPESHVLGPVQRLSRVPREPVCGRDGPGCLGAGRFLGGENSP